MYMVILNQWLILWAIVVPIQIKLVHYIVSYQQATHHTYDRRGYESPSGYGPLKWRMRKLLEGPVFS